VERVSAIEVSRDSLLTLWTAAMCVSMVATEPTPMSFLFDHGKRLGSFTLAVRKRDVVVRESWFDKADSKCLKRVRGNIDNGRVVSRTDVQPIVDVTCEIRYGFTVAWGDTCCDKVVCDSFSCPCNHV